MTHQHSAHHPPPPVSILIKRLLVVILVFPQLVLATPSSAASPTGNIQPRNAPGWILVWNDEFNGSGRIDTSNWIYDTGTSYPGGPPNWGTGEVAVMSDSTNNVFQDNGYLHVRALHTGTDPTSGWTSGRIETVRTDFQPPAGGKMAVEARIQLPNITGAAARGYWPAFWMLGAPFRGHYWNWPSIGEIDIMENINGLNQWVGAFHCGINPGGPCNEPSGLNGSASGFSPSLQTAFHTYRMEFDKSVSPQEIRWYVDGIQRHVVRSSQVDATTWRNATNHGFFVILNVAIGGGWPGNPTPATVSGGTMLVDYVRVYSSSTAASAKDDLNGDGKSDLAGLNSAGQIYYTTDLNSWTRIPGTLAQLATGDFNGDGNADLAGVNGAGAIYYTTDLTNWTRIPGLLTQLVAGDFNGDGRADLAGLNSAGHIYYTTNLSTWTPIPGTLTQLVAGDFNGDGRDDLAGLNSAGAIYYSTNRSAWTRIPGTLTRLVAGDFNGDGRADLAGLNSASHIYYSTNLASWTRIPGTLARLAVGDFNGDGVADLAGLNSAGHIYYSTNLSTWNRIPGVLTLLTAGNFNGDLYDDLAGINSAGSVYYSTDLQTWITIPGRLAVLAGNQGIIPGGLGAPAMTFTSVPPLGSLVDDLLKGQVWHVNPVDYKVAVYIYVLGNWWIKPTYAEPLTTIRADGGWVTDIVTGGIDEQATRIAAFLIPNGYNPPVSPTPILPAELIQNAVAKIEITRTP